MEKEMLAIEEQNGNGELAKKLYSFIESDMSNKIEKTINRFAVSILEEGIKTNIKNNLIDVKVILENLDFTSLETIIFQ